ncbi:MAG: helix-turn-helix transcriptional regulator, partial [Asticcacaulis sp.]|nr:helix-turn-helix transcriptional regulator [Asticcacaulis sp.]
MPRQKKSTQPPAPPPPRSRLIRGDAPKSKAVKPLPVRAQKNRSLCPINLVLEAVGDSWSMLIIRDLMLRGHSSYQAFLRSEERIATNILADRLLKLEQNGLISKAADPADARKYIYALTQKGA